MYGPRQELTKNRKRKMSKAGYLSLNSYEMKIKWNNDLLAKFFYFLALLLCKINVFGICNTVDFSWFLLHHEVLKFRSTETSIKRNRILKILQKKNVRDILFYHSLPHVINRDIFIAPSYLLEPHMINGSPAIYYFYPVERIRSLYEDFATSIVN